MNQFDSIADLQPPKNNWRIRAKILAKWKDITSRPSKKFHLILVDQEGTKIQATIKGNIAYMFDDALKKGEWKIIKLFKLSPETNVRRATRHDFILEFTPWTIVNDSTINDPDLFLHPISFERVIDRTEPFQYLVDLTGNIINMGRLKIDDWKLEKFDYAEITFFLRDDSGNILKCMASGNVALKLYHDWEILGGDQITWVLRFWSIHYFSNYVLIANTVGCAEILTDGYGNGFE